jgi:hypothetical protein
MNMATIRHLVIRNQVDGRMLPIDSIDGDVTVGELLDAYKGQMGLPRDQEVTLKRKVSNKQLLSTATINGSGIQDNETLLIEMAYTAGAIVSMLC